MPPGKRISRERLAIFLPDLRPGGAERMRLNLANEFTKRGLDVDMVLMQRRGELLSLLDSRVRVVGLNAPRPRHVLGPLTRYLKQEKPAVLQASMWPLTVLAVLARRLSKVDTRVVAVEHTTWSASRLAQRWRTRQMIKGTMRWLLPKADVVVAVSEGAARDLEAFAGLQSGSVRTIYNPVVQVQSDAAGPLPAAASAWAAGPHKRVLAVGTLKAVKDFPTLVRAFGRLRAQMDARLLILGEGEERGPLESLVQSLGLAGAVEMPGFVDDTAPVYAHADIFVLSSTNEGFGNVIVEALEHGVQVVSTDCPNGPREILKGGRYGKLAPVGDVQALADAMLDSLRFPGDRDAMKRRAQDFSVEKITDQYLQVLFPSYGRPPHA